MLNLLIIFKTISYKKIILPFVLMTSFIYITCTNDSVVNEAEKISLNEAEQTEQSSNFSTARGSNDDLVKLFDDLYPDYEIDTDTLQIEDDRDTYYIISVIGINYEAQGIAGYIVQSPEEIIYLEHIASEAKVTEYRFRTNGVESTVYDLSSDPLYLNEGFNPNPPIGGVTTEKFWGSEYYWGSCGPNTNGTPGCFRGKYVRKFRFWRKVSDELVTPLETESCQC